MGFDPRTLFLVHGLTSLTFGGMLFLFWRAHRPTPWLALWAAGDALIGAGALLITLRDAIADAISIVAANCLTLAGAIVIWNGIRAFNGRQPQWTMPLIALPLFALLLAYWTYFDNELTIRISLVTGLLAAASFMCAHELLRRGPGPLSPMALVAGLPLLLDGAALTARALLAFTLVPGPSLMTAGGSGSLLIPLVGRMLTSFGFVVMTAERYIQQRSELEAQLFASQKMEALGTLAGGVAHDLNNTLVPLLALAKLTGRRLPEGSRERVNLDTILRASERARDLVSQILTFSRRDLPTLRHVDLAQVTRDSLRLLRASVPSTIDIEERIGAVPRILGDAGKLHQVITNLVTNAHQAIGDRLGKITVEIAAARGEFVFGAESAPGSVIRISVSDTGSGMAPATMTRIFDPFFTTKPAGVGTGLGLSIVHGIVTQHGGRVVVDSNLGKGTRFDVYLPTRGVAEHAPAAEKAMAS